MMTVFMLPAERAVDSAPMTKKKTRMGAMALRALVNMVPKKAIHSLLGTTRAKMTPMARPMTILRMRGTFV